MHDEKYSEENRIVHAKYNNREQSVEIVRYFDEWFIETTPGSDGRMDLGFREPGSEKKKKETKREETSIKEAAKKAAKGIREAWESNDNSYTRGSQVFFGQEDGKEFEELVKSLYPAIHHEIKYVDLDDSGHEVMLMTCPSCKEWMHIGNSQLEGSTCTDHSTLDGGCGFHGYTHGPHSGWIVTWGDPSRVKKAA